MITPTKIRVVRYALDVIEIFGLCFIADRGSLAVAAVALAVAVIAGGNGVLAVIEAEAKEKESKS